MRTSVKWINEYLSSPASALEQADVLTAVGFPCESSEPVAGDDIAQEVETTSNRGDCLSHLGLAREIAAATNRTIQLPRVNAPRSNESTSSAITVENHDPLRCPRYTARVIRGVKIGPSPAWLQQRLIAIGQIPRNNVVDCTNFVLFEYGQPSHVFDLATLRGSAIHIRSANAGEEFLPIGDGAKSIKLTGGELVIADSERPVALAGVKGGALTAVTDKTTDVVIEAASFDPVAVRRTGRSTRISSDSSYRFERGVHPAEVDEAAERLVSLILETAGGTALGGSVAAGSPLPAINTVSLRVERLLSIAGFDISQSEIVRILSVLGFAPSVAGKIIACKIPPRRIDITREIDLIEEVVRLVGLDRVPMNDRVSIRPVGPQPAVDAVRAAKNCLAGLGYVETVSPTLISERAASAFTTSAIATLRIEDERALGEPILRPSLLASLLQSLKLNRDRGNANVRLFEYAATFWLASQSHHERRMMGMVVGETGDAESLYRLVRGSAERVARELRGAHARIEVRAAPIGGFESVAANALDPVGYLVIDENVVGVLGLVNAKALSAAGLDAPIAAAELDWSLLAQGYPPTPRAQPLANSPTLDRDLSVILANNVTWAQLESTVRAAELPHLESISFVGNWRGKKIGDDRKSVTFRMDFRAADRTLRREEIDPHVARLVTILTTQLSGEIRV